MFFDVLLVFVLFHARIPVRHCVFITVFALFGGIWTYFSRLRLGRKFESCLDLFFSVFKSVPRRAYPGQFPDGNHSSGFAYWTKAGVDTSKAFKPLQVSLRWKFLF